jgi:hypothetical protein
MHHVRARGRVKDWIFVGLSIRYLVGPSVALSGLFCARRPCRVYCRFPVEDKPDRIFWIMLIYEVEGILRLKRSLEDGSGSFSLELSLLSSSQQVGIYH